MKFILLYLSLLLISSCGSSSKVATADKPFSSLSESEELKGITNDDFRPKRQTKYNAKADYHEIGALVNDVLKDESFNKINRDVVAKIKGDKKDIVGLCYLGQVLAGLSKLQALYSKNKKNPSYWNQMATCYFNSSKYRKAKIFYNKALSLNQKYIPAINNLGVIFLRENKYEKAEVAFKEVLKIKRNNKTAGYNLANLYLKFGVLKKAKKILLSLYSRNQRDSDVLLSLSYVMILSQKYTDSLKYIQMVSKNKLLEVSYSLPMYWTYKLLKNNKYQSIEAYLQNMEMSKEQRRAFNKIKSL